MPPFTEDLWDNLPPLNVGGSQSNATTFIEQCQRLYTLAVVDESSGEVLREASASDVAKLEKLLQASAARKAAAAASQTQQASPEPITFQQLLQQQCARNGGHPMCLHCRVTESPQWRRGPPEKPILCNACGTRYRRTNQLGLAQASAALEIRSALQRAAQNTGGRPACEAEGRGRAAPATRSPSSRGAKRNGSTPQAASCARDAKQAQPPPMKQPRVAAVA
eukprot:scaffold12.g8209.t1